jgi:hypothetical protein
MFQDTRSQRDKLPRQDNYLWWSLWLLLGMPLIPLTIGGLATLFS